MALATWATPKSLSDHSFIAGAAPSGASREDYVKQVATDMVARLPPSFELDKIRKKLGSEITPTTVVLLQELERFNILNDKMTITLDSLKKVGLVSFLNLIFS